MAKPALHEYLAGLQLGQGNAPGGKKGRRTAEGVKPAPREANSLDGQLRYGALVFDPVLTPLGSTQLQPEPGCEERAPDSPVSEQPSPAQELTPMRGGSCSSMEIQCRQLSLPWEASPASLPGRGRPAGGSSAEPSSAEQSPAEPPLSRRRSVRAAPPRSSRPSGVSTQEAAQLSAGSHLTPRAPLQEWNGARPLPAGSPMATSPCPQPAPCPPAQLPPEARARSRFAPPCQPAAAHSGATGSPAAMAASPPASSGGGGSGGGGSSGGGGGVRSCSRSHVMSQATRDILDAMQTEEGRAAWMGASPLVEQQQQQQQQQQQGRSWKLPANPVPAAAAQPAQQQPVAMRRVEESRAAWEALYKQPSRCAPAAGAWGQAAGQAQVQAAAPAVSSRADAERVFRSFAKQQDALDYAAACNRAATAGDGPPERIVWAWCEERRGNAGYWRSFLAASRGAFWRQYDRLAAHARHCYEVIEAGAPCHLYFDVEYATACNAQTDGNALIDALLQLASAGLRDFWGIPLEPADVLELDSSTPEKFSRHLVIRLPGFSFESNAAAGSFVHHLLTRPEAHALTVRKGAGEAGAVPEFTSAVDAAVYTRNRHFRLLWSSKGGKQAILRPSGRFAPPPTGSSEQRQAAFLASLVCNTQPGAQLLTLDPMRANARGMALAPKQAGQAGSGSLVPVITVNAGGMPVALRQDPQRAEEAPAFNLQQTEALAAAAQPFVERVACERAGGQPASVRSVAYCGQGTGVVAFSMLGPGSHWCEFVGRPHRSNRVYFVLCFGTGTFCQKCYDPDCKARRPTWHCLPPELCPRQAPADA